MNVFSAWLVHLYTTLGAVVAFATIIRIEQKNFQDAFWLMSLAVVIDATDGTLARAARVKEQIPWFDGDRLEDIIDYANYVIVPCFFLWHSALLPPQDAWWIAVLPLLASAYGFCQREAKTADHFFLGFPSYWNIVVFYLFVAGFPPTVNAAILLLLALLVFVPIKYVYPSRTPVLQPLTIALGCVWGALMLVMLWEFPAVSRVLFWVSLVFPAYYAGLSLVLHFRRQ